jgi:hypothetical protein
LLLTIVYASHKIHFQYSKNAIGYKPSVRENKYRNIEVLIMDNNDNSNFGEAAGFAAGGAVLGGGAAATLGGIGVLAPAAGIAVGIGAAPVVAAGAVVGLAAYGIKKAFGW